MPKRRTLRDYQDLIPIHDLSEFSKAYCVPLADLHEGAADCNRSVADGYIKWIAGRDNACTILNGDLLNCAWKESTPELYEDLVTPDEAYKVLVARLMSIRGKIIMITRGGHEGSIFRKVGTDFMARLSHALRPDGVSETDHSHDVPYRPEGGMCGIRLGRLDGTGTTQIFYGYATHGWGGARTIGAKVKKVEELAWAVEADFYVLSHDHTQNIHRFQQLCPPGHTTAGKPQYMSRKRKLLINTGGFIEYSGYARGRGLLPSDMGTPRVRLEVKKDHGTDRYYKDLHASM